VLGEYGLRDVALSLPSIIGVNGVEVRLEEKWQNEEYEKLYRSAEKMKAALDSLK